MHYHLEIIMPPVINVKLSVEKALDRYSEHNEDNKHAFFDYWTIGGRWSGEKIVAKYSGKAFDAFYKDLEEKQVTVSSLKFGKQTLLPASQISMVDELWRKHFPDGGAVCPLFYDYNTQTEGSPFGPDVCTLRDIPENLSASRVMVIGDSENMGERVTFMIEDSYWNGVNYVDSKWDGKVLSALEMAKKNFSYYRPEYAEKIMPKDNWLCVTVDYHS